MYLARELTGESLPAIGGSSAAAITRRCCTLGGADRQAHQPKTNARTRLWKSCQHALDEHRS